MTYTIALVGLGMIAKNYYLGLTTSDKFKLVAVCDESINCLNKELYEDYEFFLCYKEMIKKTKVDFVIVATPPSTHFEIAKDILNMNCNVLLEKPATTNHEDFKKLIEIANHKNLIIDVIFHWKYGNEVLFIKNNINKFSKIKSLKTYIFDPYYLDNQISKDKLALEGTWLDSGVNALSMIGYIMNLDNFQLTKKKYVIDANSNLSYYSIHKFLIDDIDVEIEINWDTPLNKKITYILLENDDQLIIAHTEQKVYFNSELLYNGNQITRLTSHYNNYFSMFDKDLINIKELENVHKTLFSLR